MKIVAVLSVLILLMVVSTSPADTEKESDIMKTVKGMTEQAAKDADHISVDKLASLIAAGETVNIIDIRTEAEFAAGHLYQAKWHPRGRIEFDAARNKLPPKDELIVVYCKKQGRGTLCAVQLGVLGFTQVKFLEGGFEAWVEAGQPIYNLHGELIVKEFEKKEE